MFKINKNTLDDIIIVLIIVIFSILFALAMLKQGTHTKSVSKGKCNKNTQVDQTSEFEMLRLAPTYPTKPLNKMDYNYY